MWRQERIDAIGNNNQVVPTPPNRAERPIRFEVRLQREFKDCQKLKKEWHGMIVRKKKNADGTLDLYNWVCIVAGPLFTAHKGGLYKFYMHFPDEYPFEPPVCKFKPGFFHANADETGRLRTNGLNRGDGPIDYTAASKMFDILNDLVLVLACPDFDHYASDELRRLILYDQETYNRMVERQVQEYDPILIRQEFDLET